MLGRIREAIEEVEAAGDPEGLPSLKKLSGGNGDYYRLRVGDYRVGIEMGTEMEGEEVVFARCLHRRGIYRSMRSATGTCERRSCWRRWRASSRRPRRSLSGESN